MSGIFYGIGVGPGNPDLITIGAIKLVKACGYIAVPGSSKGDALCYSIIKEALPEVEDKKCICIDIPMTKDEAVLNIAHICAADTISDILNKGIDVAYLTIGDSTIYSSFTYLKELIIKRGFQSYFVNGIPSFCASAAIVNDALAIGSEKLHVVPMTADTDIDEVLDYDGTVVIMKASIKYEDTISKLRGRNEEKNLDIYLVSDCGLDTEVVYNNISDFPKKVSYYTILIIKIRREA